MDANYFTQKRPEVCAFVQGRGHSALDVGCAGGRLGEELLRQGIAIKVDGIERDAAAAAEAASRLRRVWRVDVDNAGLVAVGSERYDLLVMADVLEHLQRPCEVLREAHSVLRPGGQLVLSIPNVRYVRVLWPLVVHGSFEYVESGVLDTTHLRFFTRSSIERLVQDAGFRLDKIAPSPSPWRKRWQVTLARALGDFGAEQFLIRAYRD